MIVDNPFKVDAETRRTKAGADWYPRRDTRDGLVHWYYGPRLVRGVELAAPMCSASSRDLRPLFPSVSNTCLSEKLSGGTPCPECAAEWDMT